eukprot:Plantae.Rhodophyta-Hildenbrandia_rubra.ctg1188.p1 GENE.Plantae.Rhodophyta-Hildenbrandia_rubra.ctg1188~~Plantae.Rhodophyta-Hildenbrandia_rubra.ctg1188.p1  ORF type:complete len:746 (-),score=95.69 Plantae.Rhodophyta-Hildenbrandia_rubra.ctg1188:5002-7239(-)
MAHHLSPTKPVGQRFRAPDEDAYTFTQEFYSLAPTRTTAPAASSSAQGGASGGSGTNASGGNAKNATPALNGPLGLATATMVSVVRGRRLAKRSFGDEGRSGSGDSRADRIGGRTNSGRDGNASAGGGNGRSGNGGSGSVSQTASNSLFSLKKIAVLGSSITSKFTSSEPAPKTTAPKAPPKVAPGTHSSAGGSVAGAGGRKTTKSHKDQSLDSWSVNSNDGFLAYNYGDSMCFSDISSQDPEPASTIKLRATPTCHEMMKVDGAVRMVVGCANGEVSYFQDVSGVGGTTSCTNVFNKDGVINSTRVTAVRWLPQNRSSTEMEYQAYQQDKTHANSAQNIQDPFAFSQYRFIATHLDGSVILYDIRYKQTTSGVSANPPSTTSESKAALSSASHFTSSGQATGEDVVHSKPSGHRRTIASTKHEVVLRRNTRSKRSNPIMTWFLPGCGAINAAQFSPCPIPQNFTGDHRQKNETHCLALACRDGYLRILDFTFNCISLALRSYYGAIISVTWSPDGKYIATGGEDDLVSIWDPVNHDILARCAGHTSWVSNVSWDLPSQRKERGRYRIGSAGQDAKLILWDFSLPYLRHRPGFRGPRLPTYSGRDSENSRSNGYNIKSVHSSQIISVAGASAPSTAGIKTSKLGRLRKGNGSHAVSEYHMAPPTRVVDAKPRADVPILEPVCAHVSHTDPLTDILFIDAGLLTADCRGVVKLWARPMASRIPILNLSDRREMTSRLQKQRAADLD